LSGQAVRRRPATRDGADYSPKGCLFAGIRQLRRFCSSILSTATHLSHSAMQFQGALLREQGQTFAVVVVKSHIVDNRSQASEAAVAFQPAFPRVPIVLAAQSHSGMRYYGRPDIARFLASISVSQIPWRTYTYG